ncbi:hypothetical protein AYO39_02230 [Actinobacteria bacterium SCGC AG-212-D09]|nr:hypothetical protein AYO39_02230 [Actinobacteria bacterium SCGC AG-212-D09]
MVAPAGGTSSSDAVRAPAMVHSITTNPPYKDATVTNPARSDAPTAAPSRAPHLSEDGTRGQRARALARVASASRCRAAVTVVLASLGSLLACANALGAVAVPRSPAPVPGYLFSIPSAAGSLVGPNDRHLTLRLKGARAYLTRFTDRPLREAFVVADRDFARRFRTYFADSKPNGVLTYTPPDSRIPVSIVLALGQPRWNAAVSTWTFPAIRIRKEPDNLPDTTVHIKPPRIPNPRKFGHATLVIDNAPPVCQPVPHAFCIGANFAGANFAGVNFAGAIFQNTDLTSANLTGANLSVANFLSSTLTGAALTGANLSHANIQTGSLRDADLAGANLTGAATYGTTGAFANVTNATLVGADLNTSIWNGANFSNSDLTNADLTSTVFTNANLTGANLTNAAFSDANFTGASLPGANLTGANLDDANIPNADFTGANLTGANFTEAAVTGDNFTNAHFCQTTLTDGSIDNADC